MSQFYHSNIPFSEIVIEGNNKIEEANYIKEYLTVFEVPEMLARLKTLYKEQGRFKELRHLNED